MLITPLIADMLFITLSPPPDFHVFISRRHYYLFAVFRRHFAMAADTRHYFLLR